MQKSETGATEKEDLEIRILILAASGQKIMRSIREDSTASHNLLVVTMVVYLYAPPRTKAELKIII